MKVRRSVSASLSWGGLCIAVLCLLGVVIVSPVRGQEGVTLKGIDAVRFLYQTGHYAEARKACYTLLWYDIHQPEVLYFLAESLDNLGQIDQAAVFYHLTERYLAENPPPQANANVEAAIKLCQARLQVLDTAHRAAAKQYLETAPGKTFTTPEQVGDLWMSQVEADWASLHDLYLWPVVGGRKDFPATWIHNAQGVMHRSGAKYMDEVDGRKGVLFCVSRKDATSSLRFRNSVRGDEVRIGVEPYDWPLELRLVTDGQVVFSGRVEANAWTDLNIPLGQYAGKDVPCAVELVVPQDQQYHEGAFFDYVDIFGGVGPAVQTPGAQAAPADLPPSLNEGLIGYWPFEEGSGFDVRDASGDGNDGVLRVASRESPWVRGCPTAGGAHALHFDGRITCVEIPDHGGLATPNALTVACWVRLDRIKQDRANHTFVAKWGPGADGAGESFAFWMDHQDYNELCLWVSGGRWSTHAGTQISSTTNALMTAGEWCHVAVVWEANKAPIFYKNGRPLDSQQKGSPYMATLPGMQTTATPIKLGEGDRNPPGGIHRLEGELDDVRLYNRALSPEEIAALAGVAPAQGKT